MNWYLGLNRDICWRRAGILGLFSVSCLYLLSILQEPLSIDVVAYTIFTLVLLTIIGEATGFNEWFRDLPNTTQFPLVLLLIVVLQALDSMATDAVSYSVAVGIALILLAGTVARVVVSKYMKTETADSVVN